MINKKEKIQTDIIKACCEKKITERDAALRLKISVRQVQRLKAKYKKGISFLHGNCGKLPAITLPESQKQKILEEFCKEVYKGVNFTHFTELISNKPFAASYTAISKLLRENGYKSSQKRQKKSAKEVHKTRKRRSKRGELIQIDGSPHDWFNTGNLSTIHVCVDDATSDLVGLHMSDNECSDGYYEAMRYMLEKEGTPEAIYADGLSIFFSNGKQDLTIEDELAGTREKQTQFGKICDELGIELIHAHSAPAKGRVESANDTLQGRLPVEFALRGIDNIEAANKFLKEEYIDMYNAKFGVNHEVKSCFVKLPSSVDLDELLSWKTTRKTDRGGCFSLNNVLFRVEGTAIIRKTVEVLISKRLGIVVKHNNKFYDVIPISFKKQNIDSSDSTNMIVARFVALYTLKNEHCG